MKEFRILQNCSMCGGVFDSDYGLSKHKSKVRPQPEKAGWIGGEGDSCGCDDHAHQDS